MEILAENRFVMTKELYVEARLALSRDGYGRTAKKIGVLLLVLSLVLAGGSLLFGLSAASVGMELVILGFMAFWLFYLFPRSSAKTAYKALVKEGGGEPERVTRFYDDHLEIQGPGIHADLSYSQIEQILYTKHLLILVTDERGGVLLMPDRFTIGGAEEVRRLLETGKAE